MKTVIIEDIETGEILLRMPQCTERSDGTLWAKNGIPLFVFRGLPNAEQLKSEYSQLFEYGRLDDIPLDHAARIGEIRGLRVQWEEEYRKRPEHPARKAARIQRAEEEKNRISVYLSTRGWGDFPGVVWEGDRRRPTSEIVAECQTLLRDGYDVDKPDQSDEDIAALVEEEKQKSLDRDVEFEGRDKLLSETQVPENAVKAYIACSGDPENFHDDIDDPRYWLVREYAAAIEHQGLAPEASMRKAAREFQEAAREEANQYPPGA